MIEAPFSLEVDFNQPGEKAGFIDNCEPSPAPIGATIRLYEGGTKDTDAEVEALGTVTQISERLIYAAVVPESVVTHDLWAAGS